jgi:CheY-like chemotaxis protein
MVPTILVLDRNSTVQRVMKLALKEESVRVNTIQRGEDAFASIDANPPDIIFTDDARKVAAFLKSRPRVAHTPVVLLKGAFDSSGAADEAIADEVLTKPLQPDAIVECVRRLLRPPTAAAARVEAVPPGAGRADEELDLEQYFDRLDAAFAEAESTAFPVEPEPWDGGLASIADAAHSRPAVARAGIGEPALPAQVVTAELVDQITQRVLDRLGERIVRSTATEVVSRLSKWLLVNEVGRTRNTQ